MAEETKPQSDKSGQGEVDRQPEAAAAAGASPPKSAPQASESAAKPAAAASESAAKSAAAEAGKPAAKPAAEERKPAPAAPSDATAKPEAAAKPKPEAAKPARPAAAKPRPKPRPRAEPPKAPQDQAPPEDMELPSMVTAVQNGVSGAVQQVSFWVGDWTIIVSADRLFDVMRFLKDDAATSFDYCSDVTAADWPPREKRFDVIYCLYSTRLRHRLRVKVRVSEDDPVESVVSLWPAADWLEREVYDQFGVNIVNHPDLRRILMPDHWQGYPQRKDYPLEGPGEFLMEGPQDWLRVRNIPDEAGVLPDEAGVAGDSGADREADAEIE